MKKQMNIFLCDECEKKSELCEEEHRFHTGYPYRDGWVYLYALKFKNRKDLEKSFSDKHFCSIECMSNFIDMIILKERQRRDEKNEE